jgi:hypothetical protein
MGSIQTMTKVDYKRALLRFCGFPSVALNEVTPRQKYDFSSVR